MHRGGDTPILIGDSDSDGDSDVEIVGSTSPRTAAHQSADAKRAAARSAGQTPGASMANPAAKSHIAACQQDLTDPGNPLGSTVNVPADDAGITQDSEPPWAPLQRQLQQLIQTITPYSIAATRVFNATVPKGKAPYLLLPTAAGVMPAGMPANASALRALNGAGINAALQAYGLPTTGNIAERKNRFAQHWGIVNVQF